MEQDTIYTNGLFGILKKKYGDKLVIDEDGFRNKIGSDEAYAKGVFGILKKQYGDKLTIDEGSFLTKVKKKDLGGGGYSVSVGAKGSVAEKHNNPGNLIYAGQPGATKGDKREDGTHWARFDSVEEGFNNIIRQVGIDANKDHTLQTYIAKYAPAHENNTAAYLAFVMKETGLKADAPLTDANAHAIAKAQAKFESSTTVSPVAAPKETPVEDVATPADAGYFDDNGAEVASLMDVEREFDDSGFGAENAQAFANAQSQHDDAMDKYSKIAKLPDGFPRSLSGVTTEMVDKEMDKIRADKSNYAMTPPPPSMSMGYVPPAEPTEELTPEAVDRLRQLKQAKYQIEMAPTVDGIYAKVQKAVEGRKALPKKLNEAAASGVISADEKQNMVESFLSKPFEVREFITETIGDMDELSTGDKLYVRNATLGKIKSEEYTKEADKRFKKSYGFTPAGMVKEFQAEYEILNQQSELKAKELIDYSDAKDEEFKVKFRDNHKEHQELADAAFRDYENKLLSEDEYKEAVDEVNKLYVATRDRMWNGQYMDKINAYKQAIEQLEETTEQAMSELSEKYHINKDGGIDKNIINDYYKIFSDISGEESAAVMKKWGELSVGGKIEKALDAGVFDMIESVGGGLSYFGYYDLSVNISNTVEAANERNGIPHIPFDGAKSLIDGDWWIANGVRSLPFTMALMPIGFGAGSMAGRALATTALKGTTKALISGAAAATASRPFEAVLEGGSDYNQVIKSGGSPDAARRAFNIRFKGEGLTYGTEILQMGALFMNTSGFWRNFLKYSFGANMEGFEEVYQGYMSHYAQASVDVERPPIVSFIDRSLTNEAIGEYVLGTATGVIMDVGSVFAYKPKTSVMTPQDIQAFSVSQMFNGYMDITDRANTLRQTVKDMHEAKGINDVGLADALKAIDQAELLLETVPTDLHHGAKLRILQLLNKVDKLQRGVKNENSKELIKKYKQEINDISSGVEPMQFINGKFVTEAEFERVLADDESVEAIAEGKGSLEVQNNPELEARLVDRINKAKPEVKQNPNDVPLEIVNSETIEVKEGGQDGYFYTKPEVKQNPNDVPLEIVNSETIEVKEGGQDENTNQGTTEEPVSPGSADVSGNGVDTSDKVTTDESQNKEAGKTEVEVDREVAEQKADKQTESSTPKQENITPQGNNEQLEPSGVINEEVKPPTAKTKEGGIEESASSKGTQSENVKLSEQKTGQTETQKTAESENSAKNLSQKKNTNVTKKDAKPVDSKVVTPKSDVKQSPVTKATPKPKVENVTPKPKVAKPNSNTKVDQIKDEAKVTEEEVDHLNGQIEDANAEIRSLKNDKAAVRKDKSLSREEKAEQIETLDDYIEAVQDEMLNNKADLKSAKSRATKLKTKLNKETAKQKVGEAVNKADVEHIDSQIESTKQELAEAKKKKEKKQEVNDLKDEIENLESEKGSLVEKPKEKESKKADGARVVERPEYEKPVYEVVRNGEVKHIQEQVDGVWVEVGKADNGAWYPSRSGSLGKSRQTAVKSVFEVKEDVKADVKAKPEVKAEADVKPEVDPKPKKSITSKTKLVDALRKLRTSSKEGSNLNKLTNTEISIFSDLVDALADVWAKYTGKSKQDFYERKFGDLNEDGTFKPDGMNEAFGVAEILHSDTVQDMIYSILGAHVLPSILEDLSKRNPMFRAAFDALKTRAKFNGKWDKKSVSVVADMFMEYLSKGRSPIAKLNDVFGAVKDILIGTYDSMAANNVVLTPNVTLLFDRLVAGVDVKMDRLGDQRYSARQVARYVDNLLNLRDVRKLATSISKRLNMPFRIVYDPLSELSGWVESVNGKPLIVFNFSQFSRSTLVHEFAHPLVESLEKTNPELFNRLYNEAMLTQEGQDILEEKEADKYSESKIKSEVLSEIIGRHGADMIESQSKTGKFLRSIYEGILKMLGIQKNIKITSETSLYDIAKMILNPIYGLNEKLEFTGESAQQSMGNRDHNFVTRLLNDKAFVDDVIMKYLETNLLTYSIQHMGDDFSSALDLIKTHGIDGAIIILDGWKRSVGNRTITGAEKVWMANILLKTLNSLSDSKLKELGSANEADKVRIENERNIIGDKIINIVDIISREGSDAGRLINAHKSLNMLSSDGHALMAVRMVKRENERIESRDNKEINEFIEGLRKIYGDSLESVLGNEDIINAIARVLGGAKFVENGGLGEGKGEGLGKGEGVDVGLGKGEGADGGLGEGKGEGLGKGEGADIGLGEGKGEGLGRGKGTDGGLGEGKGKGLGKGEGADGGLGEGKGEGKGGGKKKKNITPEEALAGRIVSKSKNRPKAKKFNVAKEMVNVLFQRASSQINKARKDRGIEVLKDDMSHFKKLVFAFQNLDLFQNTWEESKAIVKDKIEALSNEEFSDLEKDTMLSDLDEYFIDRLNKPVSDNSARLAFKQLFLKKMGKSISDFLLKKFTDENISAAKEALLNSLRNEFSLDEATAGKVFKIISREFDAEVQRKKDSYLKTRIAALKKGNNAVSDKKMNIIDKFTRDAHLGLFNNQEFLDEWIKNFGVAAPTPKNIEDIKRLSEDISKAHGSTDKSIAADAMLSYIQRLGGIDYGTLFMSYWYANILSGYKTQYKNSVANIANALMLHAEAAVQHPFNASRNLYLLGGFFHGFTKSGVPEAALIMKRGHNPVKAHKTEAPRDAEVWSGHSDKWFLKPWRLGDSPMSKALRVYRAPDAKKSPPSPVTRALMEMNWNPIDALKYVGRVMVAADVAAYRGLLEMRYRETAYDTNRYEKGLRDAELKRAIENTLFTSDKDKHEASDTANAEGRTGIDRKRRVYEIIEERRIENMLSGRYGNKNMYNDAHEYAAIGTYNHVPYGLLGLVTENLNGLIRTPMPIRIGNGRYITMSPGSFVVPFTRILSNVANVAMNYEPIIQTVRLIKGGQGMHIGNNDKIKFGKSGHNTYKREYTREEKAKARVRIAMGLLIQTALLAFFSGNDDDDFLEVVGHGQGNFQDNKLLQKRDKSWMPYSIRFGNFRASYQYTPLVFLLAPIGSINDYNRYGNKTRSEKQFQHYAGVYFGSLVNVFKDMTFVSSFVKAVSSVFDSKDTMGGTSRAVKNIGVSTARGSIPWYGMASQLNRAYREMNEAGELEYKSLPYMQSLAAQVTKDIPPLNYSLDYTLDGLGDEVEVNSSPIWNWRLNKIDPIADYMVDNGLKMSLPDFDDIVYQSYQGDGEYKKMTPEQQLAFLKIRGMFLKYIPLKQTQDGFETTDKYMPLAIAAAVHKKVKDDKSNRKKAVLDSFVSPIGHAAARTAYSYHVSVANNLTKRLILGYDSNINKLIDDMNELIYDYKDAEKKDGVDRKLKELINTDKD